VAGSEGAAQALDTPKSHHTVHLYTNIVDYLAS